MTAYSIAIHGGAGTIQRKDLTKEKEAIYHRGLNDAIKTGASILEKGGSATDAVEIAVAKLEDNPIFNAGKGSVFNAEGKHEMDASIMDGVTLEAGAVTQVIGIRNPIELARLVMDKSDHVFLSGEGAIRFAESMECKMEDEAYFYDELRYQQWIEIKDSGKFQLDHSVKDKKFGTVGAVACDLQGNIAAATSTGGMTNKRFGRIGDSPMIGCGNYANNKTCAVSCTGSGEYFIRGVVAYDVSCLMEYKSMSLEDACNEVIHRRLKEIGGDGGLIAVDAGGNIALTFNTEGMYRASQKGNELPEIKIYKN